jgi:hypothetical protein
MAFWDDTVNVLFPEIQRNRDLHELRTEQIRGARTQNDLSDLESSRNEAYRWGATAAMNLKAGDVDGAYKALNNATKKLPGYGGIEISDNNGQKMINIKESDGSVASMPYNLQSLKSISDRFLTYSDPQTYMRDYNQARVDHEKRNRESKGAPIELADGTKAFAQYDDEGRLVMYDWDSQKPIAGVPETLAGKQGKQKFSMDQRKGEAQISNLQAETAERIASARKTKRETERLASGSRFEQYRSDGSDGFEPGALVQYDTKTGKRTPINMNLSPDETKVLEDLAKTHNVKISDAVGDDAIAKNPIYDVPTAEAAQQTLYNRGWTGKWQPVGGGYKFLGIEKGTKGVRFKNQQAPTKQNSEGKRQLPSGVTKDQWMNAARKENPGMTDAEIEAEYNKRYL